MKTWKSIFKSKQVRKECLYSFLILMGIRLLATIPTPGTNPDYFKTLIHDNSALTFIDAMTGNGLSGMSIMALSITPYITASIMVQLAGVIYPHIHEMEKGIHCMFFSFALSFLRFYLDSMKELHSSSESCFNNETPGKSSGVFSDLFLEVFGILLLNRKRNR